MRLDAAEREILKGLWEATGLAAVLRALADVAGNTGQLIRAISNEKAVAQSWERTATYLDKVVDTKTVRSCPFP